MSKKVSASAVIAALALVPLLVMGQSPSPNTAGRNAGIRDARKEANQTVKEKIKLATSTAEKKDLKKEISQNNKEAALAIRLSNYSSAMSRKINETVLRLQNIITRLTGDNSIVSKLDAAGKNTAIIKTKLSQASDFITKAKTDTNALNLKVQEIITVVRASSTTASSTLTKAQVKTLKDGYQGVVTSLKSARTKINDVLKLIKEIPGVKTIDNGTASSTPAASLPATSPTLTN
ncbi:MAG: hypothetical protein AAB645_02050 [Patescibacteria group bacterium]